MDAPERPLPGGAAADRAHRTLPATTRRRQSLGGEPYGFDRAAATAVAQLAHQVPLALWLVTLARGGRRVLVAVDGPGRRGAEVRAGTTVRFRAAETGSRRGPVPRRRQPGAATTVARPFVEVPLTRPDGSTAGWVHGVGRPGSTEVARTAAGWAGLVAQVLAGVLAAEERVREVELAASHALDLSERDDLTGLRNRRGWVAGLRVVSAARTGEHPVTALVVDLDGLKHVNDTRGHAAGDVLLVRCAGVLRSTCRDADLTARTGGDEFAVLAHGAVPPSGDLERRLRAALAAAGVVASLGSAQGRPGEDLVGAWERADAAMYLDKRRRATGRSAP